MTYPQTGSIEGCNPYTTSAAPPAKSRPEPRAEDFAAHLSRFADRGDSSQRAARPAASEAAQGTPAERLDDGPQRREAAEAAEPGGETPPELGPRADAEAPPAEDPGDEPPADLVAPMLFAPAVNPADETAADAAQPQMSPDAASATAGMPADADMAAAPTAAPAAAPDAPPEASGVPDMPAGEAPAQEPAPHAAADAAAPQAAPDAGADPAQANIAAADVETLPFAHLIRGIRTSAREEGQPAHAADAAEPAAMESAPDAAPVLAAPAAEEGIPAGQDGQSAAGDTAGNAAENADLPLDAAALTGTAPLPGMEPPPEESPAAQVPSAAAQIAEKIQTGIQQSRNQCEIQLLPEHLGRVTVRLAMTEQGLSATIRAEDAAARNLIHDGLRELQETLERAGIRVNEVDVSGEAATQLSGEAFQGQGRSGESPSGGRHAPGLRLRVPTTAVQLDEWYAPPGEQQLTMTGIEDVQGYHVLA